MDGGVRPRNYVCKVPGCGKSFVRSEHLARHRLNHQPKQIFQCLQCTKKFVRRDLLERHQKRHQNGMWYRKTGGVVESQIIQYPPGHSEGVDDEATAAAADADDDDDNTAFKPANGSTGAKSRDTHSDNDTLHVSNPVGAAGVQARSLGSAYGPAGAYAFRDHGGSERYASHDALYPPYSDLMAQGGAAGSGGTGAAGVAATGGAAPPPPPAHTLSGQPASSFDMHTGAESAGPPQIAAAPASGPDRYSSHAYSSDGSASRELHVRPFAGIGGSSMPYSAATYPSQPTELKSRPGELPGSFHARPAGTLPNPLPPYQELHQWHQPQAPSSAPHQPQSAQQSEQQRQAQPLLQQQQHQQQQQLQSQQPQPQPQPSQPPAQSPQPQSQHQQPQQQHLQKQQQQPPQPPQQPQQQLPAGDKEQHVQAQSRQAETSEPLRGLSRRSPSPITISQMPNKERPDPAAGGLDSNYHHDIALGRGGSAPIGLAPIGRGTPSSSWVYDSSKAPGLRQYQGSPAQESSRPLNMRPYSRNLYEEERPTGDFRSLPPSQRPIPSQHLAHKPNSIDALATAATYRIPYTYGLPSSIMAASAAYSTNQWIIARENIVNFLQSIITDISSSFFDVVNISHMFDLYFHYFHPQFPILHVPKCDPSKMPALLLVSIVTLGSALDSNNECYEMSLCIHDRLALLVLGMKGFEPPSELYVLQSIALIQVFQTMFALKRHHNLANVFQSVFTRLARLGQTNTDPSDAAAAAVAINAADGMDLLQHQWNSWVEQEGLKRVLLLAFFFDVQNSTIFGHLPAISVNDITLSLPYDESVWNAKTAHEWQVTMRQAPEPRLSFLLCLKRLVNSQSLPEHMNAFSRSLLLYGLVGLGDYIRVRESFEFSLNPTQTARRANGLPDDVRKSLENAFNSWNAWSSYNMNSAMLQQPAMEASHILYRISLISLTTDILDFHVLAGGMPLVGQQQKQTEIYNARARIMTWCNSLDSKPALSQALMIIREILFTGAPYRAAEDHIPMRAWCLYLSTLVVWGYGMVFKGDQPAGFSYFTAEDYVNHMLNESGNTGSIGVVGSHLNGSLLSVVRAALADCRWELLREARITISRLIPETPFA